MIKPHRDPARKKQNLLKREGVSTVDWKDVTCCGRPDLPRAGVSDVDTVLAAARARGLDGP